MQEEITKENLSKKLREFTSTGLIGSRVDLAKLMGFSDSTITRIILDKTKPSNRFMFTLSALSIIGYSTRKKYDGQSIAGLEPITAKVGFTLENINSGLSVLGAGITTEIPGIIGQAGYGVVKELKELCKTNKFEIKEISGEYVITKVT